MTKLRPKEVKSLAYSQSVRRRLVLSSDMLRRGFGRQQMESWRVESQWFPVTV